MGRKRVIKPEEAIRDLMIQFVQVHGLNTLQIEWNGYRVNLQGQTRFDTPFIEITEPGGQTWSAYLGGKFGVMPPKRCVVVDRSGVDKEAIHEALVEIWAERGY